MITSLFLHGKEEEVASQNEAPLRNLAEAARDPKPREEAEHQARIIAHLWGLAWNPKSA